MAERQLRPLPLTPERFAPYGDVIETAASGDAVMNDARFERFDDLCRLEATNGRLSVSIARCRTPSALPCLVDVVERHPHGSQAFVPLSPCRMVVVVAPAGASVAAGDLVAFVTNGRQGFNYHQGTWHMPLLSFDAGQCYLILDRYPDQPNCDLHTLDEPVLLLEP